VALTRIDPLLLPLFQNYNRLVNRLEQLNRRTGSARCHWRSAAATQALLQQQQTLSWAERLAAAGEVRYAGP
jgi:hypothetical protein